MGFSKEIYTSGQTVITADNLNAIQDEIVRLGGVGTAAVNDYVVEQGTNGIWFYRKWNSGFAECWLVTAQSATGTAASSVMGGYYSSIVLDTPFTFVNCLKGVADAALGTGFGFTNVTTPSFSTIRIYVIGNQNSTNIKLASIYLYGYWK